MRQSLKKALHSSFTVVLEEETSDMVKDLVEADFFAITMGVIITHLRSIR